MPKFLFSLVVMLFIAPLSWGSEYTERESAYLQDSRARYTEQSMNDFLRGNRALSQMIHAFANQHGGLVSSECKVGTNYDCNNGPCTPYGSTRMSVDEAANTRGANFGCDIVMGNLACHVERETTLGGFYNFPKSCQNRQAHVRLWADCLDENRRPIALCY